MKIGRAIKRRGNLLAVPPSDSPKESDDEFHHRISVMAYELYERRGRMDGNALDDWLQAEAIVNGKTE